MSLSCLGFYDSVLNSVVNITTLCSISSDHRQRRISTSLLSVLSLDAEVEKRSALSDMNT